MLLQKSIYSQLLVSEMCCMISNHPSSFLLPEHLYYEGPVTLGIKEIPQVSSSPLCSEAKGLSGGDTIRRLSAMIASMFQAPPAGTLQHGWSFQYKIKRLCLEHGETTLSRQAGFLQIADLLYQH